VCAYVLCRYELGQYVVIADVLCSYKLGHNMIECNDEVFGDAERNSGKITNMSRVGEMEVAL